ncbi:MAG: chromate reductase [Sphingobacteriales bacterium]|jgi:chromate reductase
MITIISSTHRPDSNSMRIAHYYKIALKKLGKSSEILSLTDLPHDFLFSNMFGGTNPDFGPFQKRISDTKKFIFVIPEYNGSFPGVLKAFIDSCKFPESFKFKKAALVGLSTGRYGNLRGVGHFTGICHYIGMEVMPNKMYFPKVQDELSDDGSFKNEDTKAFVTQQIEQIAEY